MPDPTIMLIDNDRDFLIITKKFLERKGFDVKISWDPTEALQIISKTTISAVLIDLRMVNEQDENDFSGLDLAVKIRKISPVPMLINTQYPSYELARKALSPYLNQKPLIIDIVLKQDGIEKLLSTIEGVLIPKKVFLSYVREDQQKVKHIYHKLQAAGFVPWMDVHNITPGTKWDLAIQQAICKTDFAIICISKNSTGKRGYFRREINRVLDLCLEKLEDDVFLIPLRLEECDLEHEELKRFQWVNYFEREGFDKLLEALRFGGQKYLYTR